MAEGSRFYSPVTIKPVEGDIRVARKNGYLPSVTTIIGLLNKPGLNLWIKRQVALAGVTLPKIEGESADARVERILKDAEEQSKQARETGVDYHAELARYFNEGIQPVIPQVKETVTCLQEWIQGNIDGTVEWDCEMPFVNEKDGFAGTIDLLGYTPEKRLIYGDFKTCELKKLKGVYPEWGLQLSAYCLGFENAECWSFPIDRETGELRAIRWEPKVIKRKQESFLHLLAYWRNEVWEKS